MRGDDRRREHAPARVLRRRSRTRTTTAARSRSAPTACSTSGSATAARAGDPHGNGAEPRDAARQDPAHRPDARSATRRTACPTDNPFVGRAGARPRDLDVRPAQPVALLVRPRDRRPLDRRRRPGRVRGDRLRAARASRASTGAGTHREGFHAVQGRATRRARATRSSRTPHTDGCCAIVGGYVYRGRAIPALDGVYLYGDNCRAEHRRARATRRARRSRNATSASRVDVAHDVRRGRHRRALRRRARRHDLPDRRGLVAARLEPTSVRGALDHRAADAAA